MAEDISSSEIRELLSYMEKIKNFEKKYKLQLESVQRMIWGCLLLIAGILDFVFAAYLFRYGPVFIPWIFIVPVSVLLMNFVSSRPILTEEKKKKKPLYKEPIYVGLLLVIVVMIAFGNANFYYLIMPSIAVIMGVAILVDHKFVLTGKKRTIEYLTPILTIATAVVNLLGYFFIKEISIPVLAIEPTNFTIFHGIIFGFVFGIMEIIEGILTRKKTFA
ncbi:hypothetical protein DRN69_06415 [Candidatus Pacearchaeota archaeon]|nr:MAG: hypothetical protein DRN69_06415 [Candidatus Pacearchaeota archaeon]